MSKSLFGKQVKRTYDVRKLSVLVALICLIPLSAQAGIFGGSVDGDLMSQESKDVTLIADAGISKDNFSARYEFLFLKENNLLLLRGQHRVDSDRSIFMILYDPTNKLLLYGKTKAIQDDAAMKAAVGTIERGDERYGVNWEKLRNDLQGISEDMPYTFAPENPGIKKILTRQGQEITEAIKAADKMLPERYGLQKYYQIGLGYLKDDQLHNDMLETAKKAEGKDCKVEMAKLVTGQEMKNPECLKIASEAQEQVSRILSGDGFVPIDGSKGVRAYLTSLRMPSKGSQLLTGVFTFGAQTRDRMLWDNIQDTELKMISALREKKNQNKIKELSKPIPKDDAIPLKLCYPGGFWNYTCDEETMKIMDAVDIVRKKTATYAANKGRTGYAPGANFQGPYEGRIYDTASKEFLEDERHARVFYNVVVRSVLNKRCAIVSESLRIDEESIFNGKNVTECDQ